MFKLDSPFMNFLNKVCDLLILNLAAVLFSLPIFTIGASITAVYYMSYKMVRNEEGYIWRGFIKAFKENFKQATIIWLIILAVCFVLFLDFRIVVYSGLTFNRWIVIALVAAAVIFTMGMIFVFPLQARFTNTVKGTIKNSFLMCLSHLPSTILFVLAFAVPFVLIYFVPQATPLVLLLGFAAMPYFKSYLILRIFKPYEEAMISKEEEEAAAEENDTLDGGIFEQSNKMEEESENIEKIK